MNVIKWMKNKKYCIRNDSLIILAHKSNDSESGEHLYFI